MTEPSSRDQLLASRLRDTLDRSTEHADAVVDEALAKARARALARQRPLRSLPRQWVLVPGLAVAAALALVLILPLSSLPHGDAGRASGVQATSAHAMVEDPEMLDDMEMLQALAEPTNTPKASS